MSMQQDPPAHAVPLTGIRSSRPFVVITRLHGAVPVVVAEGELTELTAPMLTAEWDSAYLLAAPLLVLDLRRLWSVDAAGMTVLEDIVRTMQNRGRTLRLLASIPVRRALAVSGLDGTVELYESLSDALSGSHA